MARSRKTSAGDPETKPVVHLAARIEDSLHEFREKRARKRGLTPVVIPYMGYGAPGWTRMLCRVLLAKPGAEDDARYKKIRGWRSFTSVPVNGVTVTVKIGEDEQTVVTDRGGVAEQHIRWLLRGCDEVFLAIRHLQRLQQPLAGPALPLPFAGVGEEVIGLFRLARQQAQIVGLVHDSSIVAGGRRRAAMAV